jgi:hypothetical protein
VIINELELMKMEKKLAQICNILPQSGQEVLESESKPLKCSNSLGQYKQWRLMLYFEDIKNDQQLTESHKYRSLNIDESGGYQ